jgi:hypothetical protein
MLVRRRGSTLDLRQRERKKERGTKLKFIFSGLLCSISISDHNFSIVFLMRAESDGVVSLDKRLIPFLSSLPVLHFFRFRRPLPSIMELYGQVRHPFGVKLSPL